MRPSPPRDTALSSWLFAVAAAVFVMALLGAVTRLTESGLSITEWKPITGVLPPLRDADWDQAFALYRATPQYRLMNAGMTLAEFKTIYFWEWLHRLWGRMIGLFYVAPLAFFWVRGRVPKGIRIPLVLVLALGAAQGCVGWFMVQSGLTADRIAVSPYRLAVHLGLAFALFAALLRLAFRLRFPDAAVAPSWRGPVVAVFILAALTMLWGAFTAGLRAGLVYTDTFPFMGAHLWPVEFFDLRPAWKNFFENHAAVQFVHRVLAVAVWAAVGFFALRTRKVSALKRLSSFLFAAVTLQAALGAAVVVGRVPVALAAAHQAGALLVLTVLVGLFHATEDRA